LNQMKAFNLNAQIPLPSFEDIRKILQFWFDQQDKWFYFETGSIQSGSTSESEVPNPLHTHTITSREIRSETHQYIQNRIVGKIFDVILYPPSLLLQDVLVFKVNIERISTRLISKGKRDKYGLVFSQITYFEPINDVESFLEKDTRITRRKHSDN
jgi:hypothetical protein